MKYIIKAYASKLANPDYFDTDDSQKMIEYLKNTGWIWIECREVKKHDRQLEGIIKRCSLGSKARRSNLRALYNFQAN